MYIGHKLKLVQLKHFFFFRVQNRNRIEKYIHIFVIGRAGNTPESPLEDQTKIILIAKSVSYAICFVF